MQDLQTFLKIDIKHWVFGTITKVQQGAKWNDAWQKTYKELGGNSIETGKKGCPMKGAETLYRLGRIKGGGMERTDPLLREILDEHSKNGVYAVLALDELEQAPDISLTELWKKIQIRVQNELGEEPAASNQGGPTVAFKLWHLGLIV